MKLLALISTNKNLTQFGQASDYVQSATFPTVRLRASEHMPITPNTLPR